MSSWESGFGGDGDPNRYSGAFPSQEMYNIEQLQHRLREWGLDIYLDKFVSKGLTKIDQWVTMGNPERICDQVGILVWGHRQSFIRNMQKLISQEPPWKYYEALTEIAVLRTQAPNDEVIAEIPAKAIVRVQQVSQNSDGEQFAKVDYWEVEGNQGKENVQTGWIEFDAENGDRRGQNLNSLIDEERYGLELRIISASDLKYEDNDQAWKGANMDPEAYVQFSFGGNARSGKMLKTVAAEPSQSPQWEERFVHHYRHKTGQRDIILYVMDKDKDGYGDQDDIIGYVSLKLQDDQPLQGNTVGESWGGVEKVKPLKIYLNNTCTGNSKGTIKIGVKRTILGKVGAPKDDKVPPKKQLPTLLNNSNVDQQVRGLDAIRHYAETNKGTIGATLTQYGLKDTLLDMLQSTNERIAAEACSVIQAISESQPLMLYDLELVNIMEQLHQNLDKPKLQSISKETMKDIVENLEDEKVVKVRFTIAGLPKDQLKPGKQGALKGALKDDIEKIAKRLDRSETILNENVVLETKPVDDDKKLKRSVKASKQPGPQRLELFVKVSSREQALELVEEINECARPTSKHNWCFKQFFQGARYISPPHAEVSDTLLATINDNASEFPEVYADLLTTLLTRDDVSTATHGIPDTDKYWTNIERAVRAVLNQPNKKDNIELLDVLQESNPDKGLAIRQSTVSYQKGTRLSAKRKNGQWKEAEIIDPIDAKQVKVKFLEGGGVQTFNRGSADLKPLKGTTTGMFTGTFGTPGATGGSPTPGGSWTPGGPTPGGTYAGGAPAYPVVGGNQSFGVVSAGGRPVKSWDDHMKQMINRYTGGNKAYPEGEEPANLEILLEHETDGPFQVRTLGLFSALSGDSSSSQQIASNAAPKPAAASGSTWQRGAARMNAWSTIAAKVPISAIFNTTSNRRGPRKLTREHARLIVAQFRNVPKRNVQANDVAVQLFEGKTKKELQRFLLNMPIEFYPYLQGVKQQRSTTRVLKAGDMLAKLKASTSGQEASKRVEAYLNAYKSTKARKKIGCSFQLNGKRYEIADVRVPKGNPAVMNWQVVIRERTGETSDERLKRILTLTGKRNPELVFKKFHDQMISDEANMSLPAFEKAVKALGLLEVVMECEVKQNFDKYCQMKPGGAPPNPPKPKKQLTEAGQDELLNSMEFQYALTELRNKAVFDCLDLDGNDQLDQDEFIKGLRLIGDKRSRDELQAIFITAAKSITIAGDPSKDHVIDEEEFDNFLDKYQFAQGFQQSDNMATQFVIPTQSREYNSGTRGGASAEGSFRSASPAYQTPGGYSTRGGLPPPASRRVSEPRVEDMNRWNQDETVAYLKAKGIKPHTAHKLQLNGRQLKSLTRQDIQQLGVRSFADVLNVKGVIDDLVTQYDLENYNYGY